MAAGLPCTCWIAVFMLDLICNISGGTTAEVTRGHDGSESPASAFTTTHMSQWGQGLAGGKA